MRKINITLLTQLHINLLYLHSQNHPFNLSFVSPNLSVQKFIIQILSHCRLRDKYQRLTGTSSLTKEETFLDRDATGFHDITLREIEKQKIDIVFVYWLSVFSCVFSYLKSIVEISISALLVAKHLYLGQISRREAFVLKTKFKDILMVLWDNIGKYLAFSNFIGQN